LQLVGRLPGFLASQRARRWAIYRRAGQGQHRPPSLRAGRSRRGL